MPPQRVQIEQGTIAGTAFVVNESRAKRVDISRDTYAHLWVTDETRRLWQELATQVYPYDDISSSLRNRFYLERLKTFIGGNDDPTFVNLAAGFSSYPYLVNERCSSAEVDFARVMQYKQSHIDAWQRDNAMPQRNVQFLGADLTSAADLARLSETLRAACASRPSFFLMEGLTYYLARPAFEQLLAFCRDLQSKGSLLAFEYWPPNASFYPVFRRLETYLSRDFGEGQRKYNLFDLEYVKRISGYELQESSDIAEQERAYSTTRVLQSRDNRLPIQFAVLRRT